MTTHFGKSSGNLYLNNQNGRAQFNTTFTELAGGILVGVAIFLRNLPSFGGGKGKSPTAKFIPSAVSLVIVSLNSLVLAQTQINQDPYDWLENTGDRNVTQWIREENKKTLGLLETPDNFIQLFRQLQNVYSSDSRLPLPEIHGGFVFNFWQDAQHVRGIWRRATVAEYRKPDPSWETVLDIDHLAQSEKQNWTWVGAEFLQPGDDRCLVRLSLGGGDATIIREFDLNLKSFVVGGFETAGAGAEICWRNRDVLYVAKVFGSNGTTTTRSDPVRAVREWRRGTPLINAKTVFEGKASDLWITPFVVHNNDGKTQEFIDRRLSYFTHEYLLRTGDTWTPIDAPNDVTLGLFREYLLLNLKSDWTVGGVTYFAGSLLAEDFEAYLAGRRQFAVLFKPTERRSLTYYTATKNYLLLNVMDNISSRPVSLRTIQGQWTMSPIAAPEFGVVLLEALNADNSDDYLEITEDPITPPSVYLCTAGESKRELLKAIPARHPSDDLDVQQLEAKSKDGTLIPYFQISEKKMLLNGANSTVMTGYGGFGISELPSYRPVAVTAWVERGGVYVVANIRGGGEFGPVWHKAAIKEHRQRAYDDFIAVAQDLVTRGVTSPRHLGAIGFSNGGLLAAVMLTERPDLFGAVVCVAPLLDMRRFTRFRGGAEWLDEFGNPDNPADWDYLSKYSPYENISKNLPYPPSLFITAGNDTRINPSDARRMVAKIRNMGHDAWYLENIEGGHRTTVNLEQSAFLDSLAYTFFWKYLH